MASMKDIVQGCLDRIAELDAEKAQLEAVVKILQPKREQRQQRKERRRKRKAAAERPVEAPYGLKADGTPRKRPDYTTPEGKAKSLETRRAKARTRKLEAKKVVRLNVTTQQPLNRDEARAVRDGKVAVAGQT